MKHKKTLLCSLLLISCLILVTSMPVFAAELTEAEVQQAVDSGIKICPRQSRLYRTYGLRPD